MKFSGAVLAGGKSSRFGSDKARFSYQGKPMIQWVLESLELADDRFIIANQTYDTFNLPVYTDVIPSATPLSGIHSALVHAKHDWIAVAACDMPFLTRAYWQALLPHCHNVHGQNTQAVVVESEVGLEPLAAFYHKTLVPDIEVSLQRNQKAVHIFLQNVNVTILSMSELGLPANTFHNFNKFEDVAKAEGHRA